MCHECGYNSELDMVQVRVNDCEAMIKNLIKQPKFTQHQGITYLLKDNDFVIRIQVCNGTRDCLHCNSSHNMFIVQRMYARYLRQGTARNIINTICKMTKLGVWIQSTVSNESRLFCDAIGCTEDSYCKDQWYICSN